VLLWKLLKLNIRERERKERERAVGEGIKR
jgi:hypothetical protein